MLFKFLNFTMLLYHLNVHQLTMYGDCHGIINVLRIYHSKEFIGPLPEALLSVI